MKKCPYCCVNLTDGTTSFCPVCGKETEILEHKKSESKIKNQERTESIPEVMGEAVECCSDVLPTDYDRNSEELDKELIKYIVTLGIGFAVIIVRCVAFL